MHHHPQNSRKSQCFFLFKIKKTSKKEKNQKEKIFFFFDFSFFLMNELIFFFIYLSICQSFLCPDLVSFPVLSRIKPQIPRLVVPFRQFLQVSALRYRTPPRTQKLLVSLKKFKKIFSNKATTEKTISALFSKFSYLWLALFMVRTTTVSDHLRSPNFRS